MKNNLYIYRQRVNASEWKRFEEIILKQFKLELERLGWSSSKIDKAIEIVGLRRNSSGARDHRGELLQYLECELTNPLLDGVEIRCELTNEP